MEGAPLFLVCRLRLRSLQLMKFATAAAMNVMNVEVDDVMSILS